MVQFDYHYSTVLKNPDMVIQQFSVDFFQKRERVIDRLKNKQVYVMKNGEKQECIFKEADITHFYYTTVDGDSKQKALLKYLYLQSND